MKRIFQIFRAIVGQPVDMTIFEHRLIVQKLTYLLQTRLGTTHWFGWYVRGPYSPGVSREAFPLFEGKFKGESLVNEDKQLAEEVTRLLGISKPDVNAIDKEFELYASLLFLKKEWHIPYEEKEKLVDTLFRLKPWFSKEKIQTAVERLRASPFA